MTAMSGVAACSRAGEAVWCGRGALRVAEILHKLED